MWFHYVIVGSGGVFSRPVNDQSSILRNLVLLCDPLNWMTGSSPMRSVVIVAMNHQDCHDLELLVLT